MLAASGLWEAVNLPALREKPAEKPKAKPEAASTAVRLLSRSLPPPLKLTPTLTLDKFIKYGTESKPGCTQKKTKLKGAGRKDDAFIVDDDESMSEAEDEDDGAEREYVVVDGSDSDPEDEAPVGMAALELIAAKRKVPERHRLSEVPVHTSLALLSPMNFVDSSSILCHMRQSSDSQRTRDLQSECW